jgi:Protein of unknown function (DUF3892)
MSNYITCIDKPDRNSPHEAIVTVGYIDSLGAQRYEPRAEVARKINYGTEFFVQSSGLLPGPRVETFGPNSEFIRSHANGIFGDNLLRLAACPVSLLGRFI